ncbi:MAG: hypothetical protein Q8P31_00685 [Bacillota bacterium]|nr:hypothetical protein [Bacillota bacterium]
MNGGATAQGMWLLLAEVVDPDFDLLRATSHFLDASGDTRDPLLSEVSAEDLAGNRVTNSYPFRIEAALEGPDPAAPGPGPQRPSSLRRGLLLAAGAGLLLCAWLLTRRHRHPHRLGRGRGERPTFTTPR